MKKLSDSEGPVTSHEQRTFRCVVAANNSNGEPDFYFVKVRATPYQYEDGDHYKKAKEAAEDEGYEAYLAYDENDPGGRAIIDLFEWDTASIVEV